MNEQLPKVVSELPDRGAALGHLLSRSSFSGARAKKNWLLYVSFFIWVVLPTLASIAYYLFVASDMYVSVAQMTIRNLQGPSGGLLDSVLGKSFSSSGNQDADVVKEYLRSRQMVDELDGIVGLRKIYGDPSKDFISRLWPHASNERLFSYFRRTSDVDLDADSGVITITVRAFTPEEAHKIADTMIALADNLVGEMAERARNDALDFARKEVATAETRLREASARVTAFRNKEQDINPTESAKAVLGILATLQQEIVKTRAQLAEASSYFQPNTVAISTLKTRLAALEDQLHAERGRLAGSDVTYSRSVSQYEGLNLDLQLAERGYAAALGSLDTARKQAAERSTYLVPFVEPNMPQESTYPHPLLAIISIFVGAVVSFGITALIVAAIKEHVSL